MRCGPFFIIAQQKINRNIIFVLKPWWIHGVNSSKQKRTDRLTRTRKAKMLYQTRFWIRPIYKDLTNEALLKRCLGEYTQNANKSFNNLI